MKKLTYLLSLISCLYIGTANASDGGLYMDTTKMQQPTTSEVFVRETAPKEIVRQRTYRPATRTVRTAAPCAQPYAVKVGTEVIDHYQTYEPVTTYRPAGTFSTRRTCGTRPCGN